MEEMEVTNEPYIDDFVTYIGAIICLESAFLEKLKDQTNEFQLILEEVISNVEAEVTECCLMQLSPMNSMIEAQKLEMAKLKEKKPNSIKALKLLQAEVKEWAANAEGCITPLK